MKQFAFWTNWLSFKHILPVSFSKPEKPIRAEFYSDNALVTMAKQLAQEQNNVLPCYKPFRFNSRLDANANTILHAYHTADASVRQQETVSPATQWLVDNYYTIDKAIKQVRKSYARKLVKQLPAYAAHSSLPRIVALAWFYLAHADNNFSLKTLTLTVNAYQDTTPLTIAELWLLPAALRFVLIENAQRISSAIEHSRSMRVFANKAADKIISAQIQNKPINIDNLLNAYTRFISDSSFSSHLLIRLENASIDTTTAIKWFHYKRAQFMGTESTGKSLTQIGTNRQDLDQEQNYQAANGITMGNIIKAFKAIDDIDWTTWFESVSMVDIKLSHYSDFSQLDTSSRNAYRSAVERIFKRSPLTELDITQKAIDLARANLESSNSREKQRECECEDTSPSSSCNKLQVAEYLLGKKRHILEANCSYRPLYSEKIGRFASKLKIGSIAWPVIALTAIMLSCIYTISIFTGMPHVASLVFIALTAFPAFDIAFSIFNLLTSWYVPPRQLVGYDYDTGIPDHAKTLVAVPILIGSKANIDEQIRNLEIHFLSNGRGAIYFALISDWNDAQYAKNNIDKALLDYANTQIAALNVKYGFKNDSQNTKQAYAKFYFLHRERLFNATENCFMGWERKRGKLHELNRLLRGAKDTSFVSLSAPLPTDIRYVMTLDSDTQLTTASVGKLVGKINHPLNKAKINPHTHNVEAGYGLLQPRVTPALTEGKEASYLQRIFSGDRGLDPYVFAVSDTYQDILAEGTYTGKGLYEIDVFETALKGRVKENSVLSHDLLEGGYSRTAFVDDVEVVESYPTSFYVDHARRHRWIRGDWQLLPYIFGKISVSSITRWKMLDNLRRSLMAPALVLAFIAIWCLLPFAQALIWQTVLLLGLYISPFLSLIRRFFAFDKDYLLRGHFRSVLLEFGHICLQILLNMSFLAYNAYSACDAILRTLYRLCISHKNLLEWKSSDITKLNPKSGYFTAYLSMMLPAPILAVIVLFMGWHFAPHNVVMALPMLGLWFLSPVIAWYTSRPLTHKDRTQPQSDETTELRQIARRNWAFYEKFVTVKTHHLPPDNFQEEPNPVLAERTSPTNIGLYLLSVLAARDFGWISFQNALDRINATLQTLAKLEKFNGHIYNWYRTDTLEPLKPLYISTVDSGNLAGHLITLSSALKTWANTGYRCYQVTLKGVIDTIDIYTKTLTKRKKYTHNQTIINSINKQIKALLHQVILLEKEDDQNKQNGFEHLVQLAREICADTQNLDTADAKPTNYDFLYQSACDLVNVCRAHKEDYINKLNLQQAAKQQKDCANFIYALSEQARSMAFDMQFGFLEHKDRRLLSIGYRVEEDEIDNSCYDLLASEARLGVLFAIAKGDIKHEHWTRLGRVLVAIGNKGALLSWSGSMFEYLMPPLVLKEPKGSILDQTSKLIIQRQIQYGEELGLPWGISEAAFNARDPEMNYQYSAFGVPALGLQRGLSRSRVIAPYASLLAAQHLPNEAVSNLKRLQELGALGAYGYYDSVDFTPSRVPQGHNCAVIKNYYAHHHGMAILAVANIAHDNIMQKRFHLDPTIEAIELILQEKAPQEIPIMNAKALNPLNIETDRVERKSIRTIVQPINQPRATQLLSGGTYNIMLNAKGNGYSTWNNLAITRYQTDSADDSQGSFLFLRDCSTKRWWSTTAEPTRIKNEDARTVFTAEKAEFYKTIEDIHSAVECLAISTKDGQSGGEGRRIKLFNLTAEEKIIEIISYSELALNAQADDAAHPAFSRMFIETEIANNEQMIFAHRRRRSDKDPAIHATHFVYANDGEILETQAETNRRNFVGRGRSIRNPLIFDTYEDNKRAEQQRRNTADGTILDPVFSIRCRVKIPAKKKVELVFWTLAAESRKQLDDIIPHYRQSDAFEREFNAIWTHSQIIRHRLGVTPQDISNYQAYATYLLYPENQWQAPKQIAQNLGSQSDLWPMAISGDFPLCVLSIDNDTELPVLKELLRAHEYWATCGLICDLVLINETRSSYAQNLQRDIDWLAEGYRNRARDEYGKDHVFTLRKDQISVESYNTLVSTARIKLQAGNGTLAEQLAHQMSVGKKSYNKQIESITSIALSATKKKPAKTKIKQSHKLNSTDNNEEENLLYWNGYGGFDNQGAYIIHRLGGTPTPQPWINIITNAHFGMHVSAGGAAFTWAENSRDYQLTPWSNDPISNRPGEALYITDLASKECFSPVSSVLCNPDTIYTTKHSFGSSEFSSTHRQIKTQLIHTVDIEKPLRLSCLSLTNQGETTRSLRIYNYIEWVLGNNRAKTAPYLTPFFDKDDAAIMVRNPFSINQSERISFTAANIKPTSISSDRANFIGTTGTIQNPEIIRNAKALSNTVEAGSDSCSVMAYDLVLKPGETKEIVFYLGSCKNKTEAKELLHYAKLSDFNTILHKQKQYYQNFTGGLQVKTPDESFNLLVNYWLPYQTFACRIKARAAFYQASGAYGLRDQLQDTLSMLLLQPELAREQILAAAARQFKQGDLQHWWLPETGAGVRTTISDDIVWLAYATAHYINTTGDTELLKTEIPYIEGESLDRGQADSFFIPDISLQKASLYQHCCLALDLAIKRTGQNGLPLILGGDWNDGLNNVGKDGKGESVWLGWFLAKTLQDFIPIAQKQNDHAHVKAWQDHLDKLTQALETAGWDKTWYRRAYYDDGTPLGSKDNAECQIDIIAQAWSIISGLAPKERQEQALSAILDKLYDKEANLLRLFWPPFDKTAHNPGYIKAYPVGMRENGGQYTHGALWAIIAAAKLGKTETAYKLFSALNPIHHGLEPDLYGVEPYVAAADIYSVSPYRGHGGWTWYTGSAGWFYRTATEAILGIDKQGEILYLNPSLPKSWKEIEINWRHFDATYNIKIRQTKDAFCLKLNGQNLSNNSGIPLSKTGRHIVELNLNNA